MHGIASRSTRGSTHTFFSSLRGDEMSVLGSGLICVTLFAIGFGFVFPICGWVGDVADFGGILSGMVFIGLLDGE
jgi:hypothetical protein